MMMMMMIIIIIIIITIIIIIIIINTENLIRDVLADNTGSNEQNGCLIYLLKHWIRDLLLHFIG